MTIGYEEFIDRVYRKTGINLKAYKRPQMERRINTLMRSIGVEDYVEYLRVLDHDQVHCRKFIDHLTINVSEFLRNPPQWRVLETTILPLLLRENPKLKIWSAGCSTGEEPYSLAILLSEAAPHNNWRILATDLDRKVLEKAEEGIYNSKALVNIDNRLRAKYFDQSGDSFQVKSSLKLGVRFARHDLLRDDYQPNLDLILCRNVVIYFTEETKTKLYQRFHQALRKGGVLFTGSTEQIFQAKELGFHSPASFFYQKI